MCRRFSLAFFGSKRPDGFQPSRTYVPKPLANTGFGPPSAQCEADPDLGIYYLVRVWTEPIGRTRLKAFERRLLAQGFRRTSHAHDATVAYEPPPRVPAVGAATPSYLQAVYVSPAAGNDRTTTVMWI